MMLTGTGLKQKYRRKVRFHKKKLISDHLNYHFPIDLEWNRIPLGSKSIRKW